MSHTIEAFIYREELSSVVATEMPGVGIVSLAHGYCLTPVTDKMIERLSLRSPDLPRHTVEGFSRLSEPLARAAERISQHGAIAYVETDYFGGVGQQSAAVWDKGRLTLPPATDDLGPINSALKLLGVQGSAERDEFDTIGLGRKRSNEGWLKERR